MIKPGDSSNLSRSGIIDLDWDTEEVQHLAQYEVEQLVQNLTELLTGSLITIRPASSGRFLQTSMSCRGISSTRGGFSAALKAERQDMGLQRWFVNRG